MTIWYISQTRNEKYFEVHLIFLQITFDALFSTGPAKN